MLSYYARKDVREAIVEAARDREISVRFGDGFGKRPDILKFPEEILDLAKQGATSFHCSEELWENPLLISKEMSRSQLDNLRKGWDLILDIDSEIWDISKITAWLMVQGLKDFGINSISIKFSGNKGFHIGVPFEAFPDTWQGKKTEMLFPEAPRAIAKYLLDYISEKYIKSDGEKIIFGKGLKGAYTITYIELEKLTKKSFEELTKLKDEKKREGNYDINEMQFAENEFSPTNKKILELEKMRLSMQGKGHTKQEIRLFNPQSIIKFDTILLASRHPIRMPYSLHEKSGLVSLPFNPEKVLLFEKKFANANLQKISGHVFLDRSKAKPGEGRELFEKAMSMAEEVEHVEEKNFEYTGDAVPEQLFPPTIKKMFEGMKDGKKRASFILINFLRCVGWDKEAIEKRMKEWNEKNQPPLRDNIIIAQLRYHLAKQKVLPPNYNKYYADMGFKPSDQELRFKNPVRFALRGRKQ